MEHRTIITVGISPAWDVTCAARGLHWGDHRQLERQTITPAGKALNISRALAWMGVPNTAAGLWGDDDYAGLCQAVREPLIDLQLTRVPGRTRLNITVVDTQSGHEMHLRAASELANKDSLSKLALTLETLLRPGNLIVFSGALPADEYYDQLISIFRRVIQSGSRLALDTSGPLYGRIIREIPLTLIKPNLDELSELCGKTIPDTPAEILNAAAPLCKTVENVVVSRGARGAILINRHQAFACTAAQSTAKPVQTVGCGDFLLAGLLSRLQDGPRHALAAGAKAATARALGLYPALPWPQADHNLLVQTMPLT